MSDKNLEKRLRKIVEDNETREELIQVGGVITGLETLKEYREELDETIRGAKREAERMLNDLESVEEEEV